MRHVGAVVFCCFASNGGRHEFRGEEIFVTFYKDSSDSVKSQAAPGNEFYVRRFVRIHQRGILRGIHVSWIFDARLSDVVGGSRGASIGACITQGALFGAAHAYQNPLGIAITGTLGILMGLLVPASGRKLWPVIIGHGLFDASRFVLFYFEGPPTG